MWCLWKCCDGDDSLHGALVCLSQPPVLLLITSRGHCKVGLRWSPLCASLFFKIQVLSLLRSNWPLKNFKSVYTYFLKIQWKFKISTVLYCLRNTACKKDNLVLRKVILNNTQKVKIQQSSITACYYLTWIHSSTVVQWLELLQHSKKVLGLSLGASSVWSLHFLLVPAWFPAG